MYIRESPCIIEHLHLKAYGKVNLALDVLDWRGDGYYEAWMIMQTVGFHDRTDPYATQESGIRIETNLFYPPDDEQNLAHKAIRLLMEEFGIRQGLPIHLYKFIPVSADTARGGTDAASVPSGINKMFGLGLSTGGPMEWGVTLEADIPYRLIRRTALSEGIGERLSPLPPMPQCQVLIAKPGISVSTRTVYKSLDTMKLAPSDHPDIDGMIGAIRGQNLREVVGRFGNVLGLVTGEKHPTISRIEQAMRDYGALGVMMSGSGPTVFGLSASPRVAQTAYRDLRFGKASELAKQVYLTNFFNAKRNGQDRV